MRAIKMIRVNGSLYPKTVYGRRLLRLYGLRVRSFLSLELLQNHFKPYNITVKEV